VSNLTRWSARCLRTTAIMNLVVIGVAIVTASPERRTVLNVFCVAIVAVTISVMLYRFADDVARRGQSGGAIGVILFLFMGYTIIPSVLILVGKHEGTAVLVVSQALFWLVLFITLIITVKAAYARE